MLDLDFRQTASTGSEIGDVISQILADNKLSTAQKAVKNKDAIKSIVRRSLNRTGSSSLRSLKRHIRKGELGLRDRQRHSASNRIIQVMLKNNPSDRPNSPISVKGARSKSPAGRGFAGMMTYFYDNEETLEIGFTRRSPKAGNWAKRFAAFQKGGKLNPLSWKNFNPTTMAAYTRALGVPVGGSIPVAPKRTIIDEFQRREDPIQTFIKAFTERLTR